MYAPEFPQGLIWLNSEPLTIAGPKGQVVLIDFWTYSCINCLRTLPYLKAWHKKYSSEGLVIVGVHTPEFEFEKNRSNVERAVSDLGIEYAVVLDSDYRIWNLYSNHWWPRKFLVNPSGRIVHDHIGEGGYRETEEKIQEEIAVLNPSLELPELEEEEGGRNMVCHPTTPEYYLGYSRGSYSNSENIQHGASFDYRNDAPHHVNRAYLKGHWLVADEYAEHSEFASGFADYLALNFEAAEINVVAQSRDGDEIPVKVLLNGEPLPPDVAGEDVKTENGEAAVLIKTPRMYRLFDSKLHTAGELKLMVEKPGAQFYAFTFGGCVES